jgi:hypothetical protein
MCLFALQRLLILAKEKSQTYSQLMIVFNNTGNTGLSSVF